MKAEEEPTSTAPRTVSLGRAAGLGAVTSVVALATAIVRSKASALFLGPSGVGMAAELQQIATLSLVPLNALSGPALLTALARERNEGRPPQAIAAAFGWVLVLGLGLSTIAVGLLFSFLPENWSEGLRPVLALACAAALAASAASIGIGSLTFDGSLNTTARIQIVTGVVSALLIAVATGFAGLTGQFVAAASASVLTLLVTLRAGKASSRWPTSLEPRLDREYLRNAFVIGGASLIGAATLQTALFAIRIRVEELGGPEANGQFQAAWAVGSAYLGLVLSGMGTFVFPRYAAARDNPELQREVDEASRFVMRLAPPVIFLAIGFADFGIRLMYSHRFEGALEILKWQFVGDIAKCLAWAYAGPLLYRGKIRAYLLTETVAGVTLGLATWVLVPYFGLSAAGLAYLATYLVYLPLTAVVATSIGLRARGRHLGVALAGTVVAAALVLLGHDWLGRASALIAALFWAHRAGLSGEMTSIVRRFRRIQDS